jgi:MFS family permease
MLFRPLRHRGFRLLWIGELISQLGDVLYALVFLWLVYDVTKDAGAVGIVGAFEALPVLLFSPWAGAAADRYDRRFLMFASDVLSAILLLGFLGILAINAKPALPLICLFGFLLGAANSVAAPAKMAATPSLVPSDELTETNALQQTTQSVIPLLGNLLAAGLLAAMFRLHPTRAYFIVFGVNALSFLISAVFIRALPPLIPQRDPKETETESEIEQEKDEPRSTRNEIREGLRFVYQHPVLRVALLGNFAISFFIAPFMTAFVVVVKERFEGTPALLALIESGFFVGMGVGAMLTPLLKIDRAGFAFGLCLTLCGLTIAPMGFTHSPWFFTWMNFLCGICIPIASIPLTTLIQKQTPDGLRGRVNSVSSMVNMLITPIGAAIAGLLLKTLRIEGTFLFMAVGFTVASALTLLSKSFRQVRLSDSDTPK